MTMQNQDKMKLSVVGLGYMGMHHYRLFNQMIKDGFINASIEVLCDTDKSHLDQVAASEGVKKISDPKEAILNKDVNAVIIASPTKFHKEQAELAMKNGKAVYCEKPIGLSLEESDELARMASETEVVSQCGLVLRHSPSVAFVKSLLESGEFGKISEVKYTHDACFPFPDFGIYRTSWKKDKSFSGGGILKEANIHDIDIISRLFGDYKVEKVDMILDENTGLDTSVRANLLLNSGPRLIFDSFWHKIQDRGTTRKIEVACERGKITAEEFMFYGDISYAISGKESVTIPRGELYRKYLEQNGIEKKFKAYKQWYSSLADYAFYKSFIEGKNAHPSLNTAAEAERKIKEIYDEANKEIA